jgi:murein DD-endopeptidase MepM/ murein hydrolase activator NlpD
MKSEKPKTGGGDMTSADRSTARHVFAMLASRAWRTTMLVCIFSGVPVHADTLYKYQGSDGEWIYSDRPPPDHQAAETRELDRGAGRPQLRVVNRRYDGQVSLVAENEFYSPVEVVIALDELRNVGFPPPDIDLRWVVPARSSAELLRLATLQANVDAGIRFRYVWIPGDPQSEHRPPQPYRVPFALSSEYLVSQAFPASVTHSTTDSRFAVDIAMPVGTDIYAARSGTVVEVASDNYRGGFDTTREGAEANLVRILHDDGTFAIYAHLNRSSIRVRPGDKVLRGQYIADSGNTGFSSGPHLHFAIVQNRNLRLDSVAFLFEGANSSEISPATGMMLRAY